MARVPVKTNMNAQSTDDYKKTNVQKTTSNKSDVKVNKPKKVKVKKQNQKPLPKSLTKGKKKEETVTTRVTVRYT
tara:strand:- start:660 stop:884 length:225 start_codon:yes stop_codon:yes gene_type:complete